MGAFYNSIQIRTQDRQTIKMVLKEVAVKGDRNFLIGTVLNNWIAVYSDDPSEDDAYAAMLSKRLNAIAFSLLVYDSDVFVCKLFRNGQLVSHYSSDPGYFEEPSANDHENVEARSEVFLELLDSADQVEDLNRLLDGGEGAPKFTFAEDYLAEFSFLLGIRNVLTSYEDLLQGPFDIEDWKHFTHIPPQEQ